ncbi:MAG TPA: hypothetical protein VFW75_14260 [Acetobacteraceae bacterium]|nr:hypothetical protein [Acetobacteraceae bacterium]
MADTTFSAQAVTRGQQCGIPQWIARLLLEEGERAPAARGLLLVYFSTRARRRVCRRAKRGEFPIGKLDHAWGSYLVVTRRAPQVVSIGHLGRRRIRRR